VDDDVRSVVSSSHFAALPDEVLNRLMAGSVRVTIQRDTVIHREGDPAPHLELVLSGAVRVYVTSPDGRAMTIRYCRRGDILGAMSLFSARFAMPAAVQALVDAQLLYLRPAVVKGMSQDPRVATALLTELSERGQQFVREAAGGAFSTVRERVARHLLDLAATTIRPVDPDGHSVALLVPATQQQLADAAGTAREVVVKVLRALRDEGIVRTGRNGIVLLDPEKLIVNLWNQSS
jgi:CRP/FNR family cyclic AMP-dependent transcriptional regulator